MWFRISTIKKNRYVSEKIIVIKFCLIVFHSLHLGLGNQTIYISLISNFNFIRKLNQKIENKTIHKQCAHALVKRYSDTVIKMSLMSIGHSLHNMKYSDAVWFSRDQWCKRLYVTLRSSTMRQTHTTKHVLRAATCQIWTNSNNTTSGVIFVKDHTQKTNFIYSIERKQLNGTLLIWIMLI